MQKRVLLTSVLGLGLFAAVPPVQGQSRDRDREINVSDYRREKIDVDDLPKEVRETARTHRSGQKIEQAFVLNRGNDRLYAIRFEGDGAERQLIIRRNGDIVDANNLEKEGRQKVKFRDLPAEVRESIRRETSGQEFEDAWQVTRGNRTFYQIELDKPGRGGERVLRIGRDGKIINERDLDQPRLLSDRDRNDRDRNDRDRNDRDRRANDVDDDYADWNAQRVSTRELPGEIKAAVGRHLGRDDEISSARKLTHGRFTVYSVEVSKPGERAREYIVDTRGNVIDQNETTEAGRRRVSINDVPGEVKTSILEQLNGDRPREITQVTRGGKTFWEVQPDRGRSFLVGGSGNVYPMRSRR